MSYTILHLSDIHFDANSGIASQSSRNVIKEKLKARKKRISPDCILITGDLFNKGTLKKSVLDADFGYKAFIELLKNGNDNCIVVVLPGNHDLDRNYQISIGNYNLFETRREKVLDLAKKAREGQLIELSNAEKQLLYEPFKGFLNFSQDMGFYGFSDPESIADSSKNCEVRVVTQDGPWAGHNWKIRFVLLNTALIAGQGIKGDDYRKFYSKIFRAAENESGSERAERCLRAEILKERFENDGELILDDEQISEQYGNMSWSEAGNADLSHLENEEKTITFFAGHHPISSLVSSSRDTLLRAIERCNSQLYFCGHSHTLKWTNIYLPENQLTQVQSGSAFEDSKGYADFGFSAVTIEDPDYNERRQNWEVTVNISTFFYGQRAGEKKHWFEENKTVTYLFPDDDTDDNHRKANDRGEAPPDNRITDLKKLDNSFPPRDPFLDSEN